MLCSFGLPVRSLNALLLILAFCLRSFAGDYTYAINDLGSVTIDGYTGPGGAVVIPDRIDGFPVSSIGPFSFCNTSLTSILIPEGVTSVGASAFSGCTSLTSATI